MTVANWPNCYKVTRVWEGGNVDDPRDPGGRTSRGVIQRVYDAWRDENHLGRRDVYKATEEEIAEIYRTKYWNAVLGDQWPEGADLVVWDTGVNSGPGRAKTLAQAVLGNLATFGALAASCRAMSDRVPFIQKFCKRRQSFYDGIRYSGADAFRKGWARRNASMEANGVRMALAAAKVPHEEIKEKLEAEAKAARTKANNHTGGAAASTTGGAATTQFNWHSLDWVQFGIALAIVAGLVILVLFFIRWARTHGERAQAYAAVASATGG